MNENMKKKKDLKKQAGNGNGGSPRKVGRPSKYPEIDLGMIRKLAELGMTNEEIAYILGIAPSTIYEYQKEHPEFSESLKKGKAVADEKITRSLYERALGYYHKEDKIFLHEGKPVIVPTIKHYPPEVAALIYWTKNRMPGIWRDKVEFSGNVKTRPDLDYSKLSDEELRQLIALSKKAERDDGSKDERR